MPYSIRLICSFTLLVFCCLLGGGASGFSVPNVAIYVLSTICLAVLVYDGGFASAVAALPRTWVILLTLIWLFPLLQLVPLPPALWEQLPGRGVDAAVRQAIGSDGKWNAMSLSPTDGFVAFFGSTVFTVLLLSTVSLERKEMRILLWAICAFGFLNILIGAFQLTSGGQYFDFYRSGHRANVIGFFANRNHTALFLAGTIGIWTYLVLTAERLGPLSRYAGMIAFAGATFFLFGIIGTTSRAGLAMGAAALTASLAIVLMRSQLIRNIKYVAVLFVGAALPITTILTSERFENVLRRFDSVTADLRWSIWEQSWTVAQIYAPFGTGLGTFRAAYDRWEPIAMVSPQYVNNAHNDYLEMFIEGGIPGLLLLLAAVVLVLVRIGCVTPRIIRTKLASVYLPVALFILFTLLHSSVDYPLRRLAIIGPFAVCLAILLRNVEERKPIRQRAHKPA